MLYFLPGIIFLGIVTSYSDIIKGKIRNKWVLSALFYSIIIYIFLFITGNLLTDYFFRLSLNMVFALFVGFGFWYLGLWTAGDGKLFISFIFLMPLSVYRNAHNEWFPGISLLFNIFISATLILLIFILVKIDFKKFKVFLKPALKQIFHLSSFMESLLFLFAVFWLVGFILSLFSLQNQYSLLIITTLLVFSIIRDKGGKRAILVLSAISSVRLLTDKSVYSTPFLANFFLAVFLWFLIRTFVLGGIFSIARSSFSQQMQLKELKPGMMLSETIIKKDSHYSGKLKTSKSKIIKNNSHCYIKQPKSLTQLNSFIKEEAEGLTQEQINKIRKTGFKKIRVSKTIPFAPFIFFGVILTILFKGNILAAVIWV
ncbi:hypothetical protein GF323_02350 [Candidatus Woesearchaeota archaeon]|nr:hypothetical protein [Candidatus Woesearchaeota archaeon]